MILLSFIVAMQGIFIAYLLWSVHCIGSCIDSQHAVNESQIDINKKILDLCATPAEKQMLAKFYERN